MQLCVLHLQVLAVLLVLTRVRGCRMTALIVGQEWAAHCSFRIATWRDVTTKASRCPASEARAPTSEC